MDINNILPYFQLAASVSTTLTILITALIFLFQRRREIKVESIKAGTNIEQIVIQWSYVDMVIKSSFPKEHSLLINKELKSMCLFEQSEKKKVFTAEEIKTIGKIFIVNNFNGNEIGPPTLLYKVKRNSVKKANARYPKIVLDTVGRVDGDEYIHTFHRILVDTLNKIETLSSMIYLNVADEYTAYSLLGDSFLGFIKLMYYYIATINADSKVGKKKLSYTIAIFNKWKKRKIKEIKK